MRVLWDVKAWDHYIEWQETNRDIALKINALITDIRKTPFSGVGKPEPLRRQYSGFWSRRITREHRLVYRVAGSGDNQTLQIAQCRYHYSSNDH